MNFGFLFLSNIFLIFLSFLVPSRFALVPGRFVLVPGRFVLERPGTKTKRPGAGPVPSRKVVEKNKIRDRVSAWSSSWYILIPGRFVLVPGRYVLVPGRYQDVTSWYRAGSWPASWPGSWPAGWPVGWPGRPNAGRNGPGTVRTGCNAVIYE